MIGTPEYMSPEQAEMTGARYRYAHRRLFTGRHPVRAADWIAAVRSDSTARERPRRVPPDDSGDRPAAPEHAVDDRSPRRHRADRRAAAWRVDDLARQLRGDLDWITLRALEKDRTRRYGSVSDLAADLQRHLQQPARPRQPSEHGLPSRQVRPPAPRRRGGRRDHSSLCSSRLRRRPASRRGRIARERDRANREAETAQSSQRLPAERSAGTSRRERSGQAGHEAGSRPQGADCAGPRGREHRGQVRSPAAGRSFDSNDDRQDLRRPRPLSRRRSGIWRERSTCGDECWATRTSRS